MLIGFLIWLIVGAFFLGFGIYAMVSKREKPLGFWANAEVFPVKEVRNYNRAVGKLWCVYGIIFGAFGLPLLQGQNSPAILLSVVGVMVETIVVMVIYVVVIEKRYRK